MINFPSEWIIYLNGVLVIWFLITLYRGYQRGFLLQLVDVCGTIVSLFAAWLFAPVFTKIYQFVGIPGNGFVTINQLILYQVNTMIWFVILFVLMRIILLCVTPLATLVSKVPLIKEVNSAIGGVFSVVFFAIKVWLLMIFLTTPMIKNGQEIINGTWLKHAEALSAPLSESVDDFIKKNEAIQSIVMNRTLTAEQHDAIASWLQEKGFNEQEIKEFIKKYE